MAEENYSKSLFTPKNILIYLVVGGIIPHKPIIRTLPLLKPHQQLQEPG
ncbi:hypothetical protein HY087_01655 [Candidatus Gottesmanbacteria bacterium]|nr:hypothetical protein [Candidatus Gottesmanbacteria bacterium]